MVEELQQAYDSQLNQQMIDGLIVYAQWLMGVVATMGCTILGFAAWRFRSLEGKMGDMADNQGKAEVAHAAITTELQGVKEGQQEIKDDIGVLFKKYDTNSREISEIKGQLRA